MLNRIAALTIVALPLATLSASGFPNYAREHPAACAEAWEKKTFERTTCGSRKFCAVHKNDDRISKAICDPYISHANPILPSLHLSTAWLGTARNLNAAEARSECMPGSPAYCAEKAWWSEKVADNHSLYPAGLKSAKLALRAEMSVYTFRPIVVRIGIASSGIGVIEVSWGGDGGDVRQAQRARLNPAEIDRLLLAVNRSDFWRLPLHGRHSGGGTDGNFSRVELSVSGWKSQAEDMIGDTDAVDLSVLVSQISRIVNSRWKVVLI